MPRGRKGPPQESIDSILLAISRRNDIDSDTLSHYFDRLDEEWEDGARDKVLHLLRTTDKAAHAAAILILSELATDLDLEDLEDFVTDPTVTDLAKLTMVPLLKELGSDMADDGIIEYLNDPNAAMLQMQMHLLDLVGQSELGVESILEDVISMPQERRLGFISWLGSSQDPRAARLLIPLLETQSSAVVLATIESLEQLGTVVAYNTIPALNYLIGHTTNRQVKQRARAVLGRLMMQSAPGLDTSAASQTLLPLYEARVSYIDGTGSQMIMLAWERPDGLLKGVNILYKDDWGIKDCYGTDEMTIQYWNDLVAEMAQQSFESLDVPLAYCRAVIVEALTLNKQTRHKVPIAYAIWRPFIEGPEGLGLRKKLHSPVQAEALPLDEYTLALAQRGGDLYLLPEFSSWLFNPLDDILEYINRYWSHPLLMQLNNGSRSTNGRPRKGTKKHKEALRQHLNSIIKDVIRERIDDNWRKQYSERLLGQGLLFQLADRTEDVELTTGVASVLHPDSGVSSEEQPFIHSLLQLSIEHGPIHLMASALDLTSFDPRAFGIDLFPPEK